MSLQGIAKVSFVGLCGGIRELYDGLVKSYNLDKDLFSSYGKAYSLKRYREDKDKDKVPPAGSGQGLKKQKTSKDAEPLTGSKSKESNSRSSKGTKSQPKSSSKSAQAEELVFEAAASRHDWFKKPKRPPTPDSDWNARKSIDFRLPQTWNSKIAQAEKPPLTLNELMSNPINFLAYEYPFDLSKPLPLIEDRGHQVVPIDYIINNDLEYLKGGSSSKKCATSTTKTNAAKVSMHDMFSLKRIIVVTHVKVMKWYDYGYLEEIKVQRQDQNLYKFKEGDFPRLNLHYIEDMLLLLVQKKISNLERDVIFDLGVALRMFTRPTVILKRVEDLQLGVESYLISQ
ncbi:hypothetical protein Tco_0829332 [Tanacetum coccineum]